MAKTSIETRLCVPKRLKNAVEKEFFVELVDSYSADFFNKGDLPLLIQYCRLQASADRCHETVIQFGEVVENANGDQVPSGYLKAYMSLCTSMGNMAQKLRVAPSARMRQEQPGSSAGKKASSKDYAPGVGGNNDWRDQQRK